MQKISIIIPIWNEEQNLKPLLNRIDFALKEHEIAYEIIFIDDHSTDKTKEAVSYLKNFFPVSFYTKQGKKGKAYSLTEGFAKAKYDLLVMIDADLQYPPEAIPEMLKKIEKGADVVVANRKSAKQSILRRTLSKSFRSLFGDVLFGLTEDVQAGLKVFTRRTWEYTRFAPRSKWGFDLEFLYKAKVLGLKITSHDIDFGKRVSGKSKLSVIPAGWELMTNAVSLRTKDVPPAHIASEEESMRNAGVFYKGNTYITHTTLHHSVSAIQTLLFKQKLVLFLLGAIALVGFILSPLITIQAIVGILSMLYFIDVLFNFYLVTKSLNAPKEISFSQKQLDAFSDADLPVYTILCPLFKEAHILPHFLASIAKLEYPKNKLDVLLLLEEDDKSTISAVQSIDLPKCVHVVIVPHSLPKTKPKACNYGLSFAKGEYVVIYDAEDMPDPMQLKKAYRAFQTLPRDVACLQAKLNYYNPHQNLLTRFFTAEYSLWFDVTLPGFQSLGTSIPLGGTSNHFRTKDLLAFEGWDPFNVTEDADLGIRLFKQGYKTAVIDSTTFEEANSDIINWIRQRSRWIKGYMQTYLVHTRTKFAFSKEAGIHGILFHLVMGARITFLLINPILWMITLLYIFLHAYLSQYIALLYVPFTYYIAIIALVIGNFLYFYYYLVGVAKKQQWELMKYMLLIPFYWIAISTAAGMAFYQLFFKPHYWEKTHHGLHLKPRKSMLQQMQALFAKQSFGAPTLVGATIVGNFLNYAYNAYLSRTVSAETFGLVGLMGSFIYLTQIPTGSLSRAVSHKSALLFGKYQQPIKQFWSKVRVQTWKYVLISTGIYVASIPYLVKFFHSDSTFAFVVFTPVFLTTLFSAMDGGFLSGNHKFNTIAIITLLESFTKLALAMLFVATGIPQFVYAAVPLSLFVAFGLNWSAASEIPKNTIKVDPRQERIPGKFLASSVATRISSMLFLSVDVILANHFLVAAQAGEYVILSLLGKIIYFCGSLITQFITPIISKAEGEKKNSHIIFYQLLALTTIISGISFIGIGIFGSITAPLLFGHKALSIVSHLPLYGLSVLLFTLASTIVGFHEMKHQYIFSFLSTLFSAVLIIAVSLYHAGIGDFVIANTAASIFFFVSVSLFHILSWKLYVKPSQSLANMKELLVAKRESHNGLPAIRILIFNWRDTRHRWAGGAETYIHELAKRWVAMGSPVTIFAGNDGKSPRKEVIDGVKIIRRGGTYTVYLWAALYYLFQLRGNFDVIIDSENGIPFFTPLFSRIPKFLLIHHIHQDVFREYLRFPFSRIAMFLESVMMPLVYRGQQVVTVSQSSKEGVGAFGFIEREDITVVNPGTAQHSVSHLSKKTDYPSFLFIGRMKQYKNIDVTVLAMKDVLAKYPDAHLYIAGEGDTKRTLEKLTRSLGLTKNVTFLGKVTEAEKIAYMSKVWAMLQPSSFEGWGMTVVEANACGTPVIASDVVGLRDSVVDGKTGMLFPAKSYFALSKTMQDIIADTRLRKSMSIQAYEYAKYFDWNRSTKKFYAVLQEAVYKKHYFSKGFIAYV